MADQPPKPKSAKRRVKNPETFRERALKAAEASERPKRSTRLKQSTGRTLQLMFGPTFRVLGRIFRRQPFKLIGKLLRLIGKIVFPVYFRRSWQELRFVTWPNWRESRRLTGAVLVFAVVFGAAIAVVDYGLDKLFKAILLK